jgi:hypothetical protein
VTYDGQPIDWGSISFLPVNPEHRVSGGTITDGVYSVPEEKGANAGKYKVQIRWDKLTGRQLRDPDSGEMYPERKEGLPLQFHSGSTLTVDVAEGQTEFDFDLKSE